MSVVDFYPMPEDALDGDAISSRQQRSLRRQLLGIARSDLYDNEPGGRPGTILMRSPLGWTLEIGSMGDYRDLWAAVYTPQGERYAFTEDANPPWLDATLP